jgi:predicted transcriptional regulator
MAQYSPELIEQTILIFESRTGRVISEEDARQAVENISGFFQMLQEWAEAVDRDDSSEALPAVPGMGARMAQ